MPGNAVDRPHGETVIAAEKQRYRAGACQPIGARAECTDPRPDLTVVFRVGRRDVVVLMKVGDRKIAMILDGEAEAFQDGSKTGGAQRGRSHQGSALRGANFDRRAKQRNPLAGTRIGSSSHRFGALV